MMIDERVLQMKSDGMDCCKQVNNWCVDTVIHGWWSYSSFVSSYGIAGLKFWSVWGQMWSTGSN